MLPRAAVGGVHFAAAKSWLHPLTIGGVKLSGTLLFGPVKPDA